MEPLILLLVLLLIALIVLPIAALISAGEAKSKVNRLQGQIWDLENEIRNLKRSESAEPISHFQAAAIRYEERTPEQPTPPQPESPAASQFPPPLPDLPPQRLARLPMPASNLMAPQPPPPSAPKPAINWELFMGAKLFAWIGGFTLFLGIVFFVKYSFDHNLIAPEMRVAIGFLAGIGLLLGGVRMKRKANAVTAQTL